MFMYLSKVTDVRPSEDTTFLISPRSIALNFFVGDSMAVFCYHGENLKMRTRMVYQIGENSMCKSSICNFLSVSQMICLLLGIGIRVKIIICHVVIRWFVRISSYIPD